jgi:hypothetical protein
MAILSQDKTYAVVGASTDPDKYGYQVFQDLLQSGFQAVPINPNANKLLGKKVYASLDKCPQQIDVVVFVVPPSITEKVLKQVKTLGINQVWMQPGSESQSAIEFCRKNDIAVVAHACIMRKRSSLKTD